MRGGSQCGGSVFYVSILVSIIVVYSVGYLICGKSAGGSRGNARLASRFLPALVAPTLMFQSTIGEHLFLYNY